MPDWLISFATHPVTLLMLGGGVGANARYWLGRFVAEWQLRRFEHLDFPWATFFINVSGSVVLGFVASMVLGSTASVSLHGPDESRRNWYLLLGTGFCGGFTTFSTFSLESLELMQEARPWSALAYVFGSVAAGVFGVWLALKLSGGRVL
jgi:CrcB protein